MTKAERPSLGRRAVLAMAASAAAFAAAPQAQAAARDLVDLAVVDRDTGETLRVWRHNGRLFVAGRPGARYGLRVTNNTGGRVLVVMSVDGVNILTGQTAGYDQRGYVFDPHETYEVSGWRKSDTQVAAFTFAALPQSYAARTGRPGDVGVIGLAVFRERYVPPPLRAPAPAAVAAPPPSSEDSSVSDVVTARRTPAAPESSRGPEAKRREERLGTAHGPREWSAVTTVAFERATRHPEFVRHVEYNTWRNLVAAGVIRPTPRPERRPRPFPAGGGYVPDPPGGR